MSSVITSGLISPTCCPQTIKGLHRFFSNPKKEISYQNRSGKID